MTVRLDRLWTCPPALVWWRCASTGYLNRPLFEVSGDETGAVQSAMTDLQSSIADVCELWCSAGKVHSEGLSGELVVWLLVRSLLPAAKQSDIKRVYGLRDALSKFDLDDPSADSLKSLMLRALIHPPYLRSVEGRRWLSGLFALSAQWIDHLHMAIRQQIPNGRPSLLTHYGDVLFRAWKLAQGQTLIKLGND
jgi:condensin-2 complex subunit G2